MLAQRSTNRQFHRTGRTMIAIAAVIFLTAACGGDPAGSPSSTAIPPAAGAESGTAGKEPAKIVEAATGADGSVSVIDMSGTEVTIPKPATRIVAVGSSSLDALATVGIPPIAVSGAAWKGAAQLPETFKSQIDGISQLPQSADGVSAEDVAALKPDLIFINLNGLNQREALVRIAPVAVVDSGSDGLEGALQALKIVGALTGNVDEAEKAESAFNDRLQEYIDVLDKSKVERKTALVLSDGTRNFKVATKTSSVCSMLNMVAKCPFEVAGQSKAYLSYSLESVREQNPEIIFIRDTVGASAELEQNPFWQDIDAVKNNQVHLVDHGLWVLGGTIALNKVLDEAMPLMYPEVFPEALPAAAG